MSSKRYYYSDTISDFMEKEEFEIVGELTLAYSHTINDETKRSWLDEIRVLRSVLNKYRNRGSVYFEYNIPRMGRRADVIALIDDIVFVIEFKTINSKFTHEAVIQVWDYALDLKNFQEGSRNRKMVPILVAPTEKDKNCVMELSHFEDLVYRPMQVNEERLNDAIADTDGLGAAYMIGPSYFLKLKDNGADFNKLWKMNIEPLLKEYLRGFRKTAEILEKFSKAYFNTNDSQPSDTPKLIDED